MTVNHIAHEAELMESTKLCIGAIIQPLAALAPDEEPIQVVNNSDGPVRCKQCRAYVNPFFKWVDAGHKFICNFCHTKNDVPQQYKCNLDANGLRRDRADRAELCRGTVEFVAGKDFIQRPIQDPCYLFVLDVSYTAAVTGLVQAAVEGIRGALDGLAQNPRMRVGIITYDQAIHFYSIKSDRDQPAVVVVSDVDDVFVPCPQPEIMVRVSEPGARACLEATLDLLVSSYDAAKMDPNDAQNGLCCAGAAAQVAAKTLLPTGGKIFLLFSSLPTHGAGQLVYRDTGSLYHTAKEKTLFKPQGAFYAKVARRCAELAITVDLYVCANSYVDLATVGTLSTTTGGQTFMYPGFNAKKDSEALQNDIFQNCTRWTGQDAVMVVRCSTGLHVAEHFGNFFGKRKREMDLPTIDCDKTFGIRIEHQGKLKVGTNAAVQVALLYTTPEGARRIRCHTLSLPVTSVMSDIFRFADLDAIINLSLKQGVRQIHHSTSPLEAQTALTSACIDSLYVYRNYCAKATESGQLILPEPLKLLPLCTLGLIKHPIMQPGLGADERSFLVSYVNSMSNYLSVPFVCPRLFNILAIPDDACVINEETQRIYYPQSLTLSSSSIEPNSMYLLDNGRFLYLWIGEETSQEHLDAVFDTDVQGQNEYTIRQSDDPLALCSRVATLISQLRHNKPSFQNLHIISRQGHLQQSESLDEAQFFSHLIEDSVNEPGKGGKTKQETKNPNTMTYIDFLCWIHKRIQKKFKRN